MFYACAPRVKYVIYHHVTWAKSVAEFSTTTKTKSKMSLEESTATTSALLLGSYEFCMRPVRDRNIPGGGGGGEVFEFCLKEGEY